MLCWTISIDAPWSRSLFQRTIPPFLDDFFIVPFPRLFLWFSSFFSPIYFPLPDIGFYDFPMILTPDLLMIFPAASWLKNPRLFHDIFPWFSRLTRMPARPSVDLDFETEAVPSALFGHRGDGAGKILGRECWEDGRMAYPTDSLW